MSTNQKAAILIRSLMRDLRVSDHVVYPGHKSTEPKPPAIVATVLLRELDNASAIDDMDDLLNGFGPAEGLTGGNA